MSKKAKRAVAALEYRRWRTRNHIGMNSKVGTKLVAEWVIALQPFF